MGTFTNVIIFAVTLSFFLFLFTRPVGSTWEQSVGGVNIGGVQVIGGGNLFDLSTMQLALFVVAGLGIAAGSVFPNPYLIFGALLMFFLNVAFIINDVLNSFSLAYAIDANITLFIKVILGLISMFALVEWYSKGPI